MFWPSVLNLSILKVLKIHKTKAVKNFCVQEKDILVTCNFYNPGTVYNKLQ